MKTRDRIIANLNVLETYANEHGQQYGTVSWQMALQSIKMLREDFRNLDNTFDFDMEDDND